MNVDNRRMGCLQTALWRTADRVQSLVYYGGWPARLSHLLGSRLTVRVVRQDLTIPGLPASTPALTLAFASDFHAGLTTDPCLLHRACAEMSAAKPDLLLLGGDFVSLDARQIDWLAPLLSTIAAPLGKFAVLGNHDRWNGVGRVTRTLEAHGIEVLVNENRRLQPPFNDVWVCGLDDYLTGEVDVGTALADAGGTRIVLMHAPDSLEDLAGEHFALAICGHTHGGQIAFRGGAPLMSAPGPLSRMYSRGAFRLDHGGVLLVSVGLGCSTLPVRLNSDPEIIVCRLSAPFSDQVAVSSEIRDTLGERR